MRRTFSAKVEITYLAGNATYYHVSAFLGK